LAKGLNYPQLKELKTWPLFKLGRYKSGLIVVQNNNRKMPYGILAQRTIGYIRDAEKVKVGIEGKFNDQLAGAKGLRKVMKMGGGVYKPLDEQEDLGAKPGLDVYSTIDINLQDVAEHSLMKSLKQFKAEHGCAVLMNIKTGEINAMANLTRKDTSYIESYNYAVGEKMEPGSVFKLASVISLLENNYADENTKVDLGNGSVKYYTSTMTDVHIHPGLHTLKEVFEMSSNVGISKLVTKYFGNDKEKFYNQLEKLNLTNPVGIDITGEPNPEIRNVKQWSGISLPWISIGYEVRLTPLQILNLYAAIANNGVQMRPHLIKAVKENDKFIEQTEPLIMNEKICSDATIVRLRKMLEGVVDSGTASNIRSKDYKIAGKTGTNLIANSNTRYSDKVYQGTFVGYFPANDPVYACIVVVNNPDNKLGFYGGTVAAPVFRDIADKIYSNEIAIHKEMGKKLQPHNLPMMTYGSKADVKEIADGFGSEVNVDDIAEEYVSADIASKNSSSKSITAQRNVMPNIQNMNLKDAIYILENRGLKVMMSGKGKVRGQSIAPGVAIKKGMVVSLVLG
jgi:cell division protein FtsI (penicillin-binding protein 3)